MCRSLRVSLPLLLLLASVVILFRPLFMVRRHPLSSSFHGSGAGSDEGSGTRGVLAAERAPGGASAVEVGSTPREGVPVSGTRGVLAAERVPEGEPRHACVARTCPRRAPDHGAASCRGQEGLARPPQRGGRRVAGQGPSRCSHLRPPEGGFRERASRAEQPSCQGQEGASAPPQGGGATGSQGP